MRKNVNADAKKLFDAIVIPGRRLISGKLVPVLKVAVDSNNIDLVVGIAKRYPKTFSNARTYVGKRRNARIDEILARVNGQSVAK